MTPSTIHPKILAIVLAGGKGERLFPLTTFRSKPSVPFGGRYRIVDFVLSNLVNSQIYSIYLLVQYKSQSLIEHIRQNWVLSPRIRDQFVTIVPPQMRLGPEWFEGTADAVTQNLDLIQRHNPDLVVVFGADHVYRMDIRQMIDFHLRKMALVTVAARPVPVGEATSFGVIQTDAQGKIVGFHEKPKEPSPRPGDPTRAYVSMGNYVFSGDLLVQTLAKSRKEKMHDFGGHVIPGLIKTGRVFAYDFETNVIPGIRDYEERGYWRDVGTLKAFFDANMDLLGETPRFELNNPHWTLYPSEYSGPGTKIMDAQITNSLISEGVMIGRAAIRNSIIRRGVVIGNRVSLDQCIIMDDVLIKNGCTLERTIVDKRNVVGENETAGLDRRADRFRYHIDSSGITVIPKGGKLQKTGAKRS